jgi:hypothetical protein
MQIVRLRSRLIIINPEFDQYFSEPFSESGLFVLYNYLTPKQLAIVRAVPVYVDSSAKFGHICNKHKGISLTE